MNLSMKLNHAILPLESHDQYETKTTLIIDKISLTYSFPNQSQVGRLSDNLNRVCQDGSFRGITVKAGRRHRYHVSIPILSGLTYGPDHALLDLVPRHSKISDLRLEFNPAKVGPAGVGYICDCIEAITGSESPEIFRNGKITRIDFAADIAGLTPEDVIVRSKGQRKHGCYSDQHGRIETTYLGTPQSNRTVAYDKSSAATGELLRIERRMKPLCRGHELLALPNPFQKVQLIPLDPLRSIVEGHVPVPDYLFDSIRLRGLRHALSRLPPSLRRQLHAKINDFDRSSLLSMSWLDWPEVLRSSGLPVLGG
jgi:hypothetical protein